MNAIIKELSVGTVFMGASFLIQSTLLILVAMLVARRFAHRAAIRNAIFRATLVAIVVSAPLCYALGRAGLALETVELPRAETTATAAMPAEFSEGTRFFLPPDTTTTAAVLPEAADVPATIPESKPIVTAKNVYAGLAMLWAVGCVCMLGYLAICHWLVARTRKYGTVVDEPAVIDRLYEMCDRVNVNLPGLIVCDRAKSPMLVGLRRPAIIVPQSHEQALRAGQLDGVLLHELAHLARRDCAWNLFSRFVCAVAFFQPLVWVLARRIEDTSDEVADDYVLAHGGDGRSYARDLTEIAERFLPRRRESVAGVGVIRFRSSLGRRVQRILDSARDFATHVSWKGVVSICLITAVVTVLVACLGMSSGRATVEAAPADTGNESDIRVAAADDANEASSPRAGRSARPSSRGGLGVGGGLGSSTSRSGRAPTSGGRGLGGPAVPRAASAGMSPREKAIDAALDERIEAFSFMEVPLGDVIGYLRLQPALENVNFVLYPDKELSEILVTIEMKDVSLRSMLTAMLKPRGLDFMIWSEAIYISHASNIEALRNEAQGLVTESFESPRTKLEREIEALLGKKIPTFSFQETPLEDVISYLRLQPDLEDLNIVIDKEALAGPEVYITRTLNNVSLETALKQMLYPHGLGFAILNDSLFISTKEGIRRRMPLFLRTYNVKDLLEMRSGRSGNSSTHYMRDEFLASTIYHVTGKDNWDEFEVNGQSIVREPVVRGGARPMGGGPGLGLRGGAGNSGNSGSESTRGPDRAFDTKTTWAGLDESSGLLVVNQRADIHKQIDDILAKLRAAQEQGSTSPASSESGTGRGLRPGGPGMGPGVGGFGGGLGGGGLRRPPSSPTP